MSAAKCDVKKHFDCDGTGRMCDCCGESEAACQCEPVEDGGEQKLVKCADCDGSTWLCVEHDSPSTTVTGPCDAAKKAARP